MQEGEALHRAIPLRMRDRVWIAAITLAMSIVSGNTVQAGIRGQPVRPGGYLDPFHSLVRGEYVLCYSSCAEPYGIDELHTYRSLLGARVEGFALWAVWDACAHPFYRLDELRMRICSEPFRIPASIALEHALRREAVKDFPTSHSTGIAVVIILERAGFAFSVRSQIAGGTGEIPTLIACSSRFDRFSITAVGWGKSEGLSLIIVEGELSLDGFVSFRTGYRLDTDEIRCGLGCRREGVLVTALWSHHPALGRTVTLGVGYVWSR